MKFSLYISIIVPICFNFNFKEIDIQKILNFYSLLLFISNQNENSYFQNASNNNIFEGMIYWGQLNFFKFLR